MGLTDYEEKLANKALVNNERQNKSDYKEKELCFFCQGTGRSREAVLLRETGCKHCEGTGEVKLEI